MVFFDRAFVCVIDSNPLENDMQIWHCGQDVKAKPAWTRLFQISLAKFDLSRLLTRKRWVALSLAGILLVTSAAQAAVVTVVSSGGFCRSVSGARSEI